MRKNYIYLVLLLLLNISVFGQKVTLTPTTVNGQNVSAGPINLGGTPSSTVSLNVTVEMPSIPGNNGTITIHSINGFSDNIVAGGNGGSLFFGEGKSASRSFLVTLQWSSFATSGSYIYAEYKTSTSVAYKSSYLAVIKNPTQNGGGTLNPPADAPNPSNIVNTLCCNQTIRQGDKPAPITGSQYLNPYEGLPHGINSRWSVANGTTISLDNSNKILDIDYTTDLKNLTVTRELGYVYGGQFPNKSNTVTITVLPTPIINEITIDGGKDVNGFVEIIDANPKPIYSERTSAARVNLNILENPYHVPVRGDSFAAIERYEWEYTKTNYALGGFRYWKTLEGENSSSLNSFNPSDMVNNEDNYYLVRRITFYKNIKNASNIIGIIPRMLKNNNIICCDQILGEDPTLKQIEKPSIITGSIATIENIPGAQIAYTNYQWQSQAITNERPNQYSGWTNIAGATTKDYLPAPLQYVVGSRGSLVVATTYNYRRIATINYQINNTGNFTSKSYSNEINVKSGRIYGPQTLFAYPNPASSLIYIENKGTDYILSNTTINIANTMGTIVNSNNFSIINQNLISIDVSNFPIGTYFINIQTGVGTRDNAQLTFIKSN